MACQASFGASSISYGHGKGVIINTNHFLPKKIDERSLASNDKMYRNAMGALARDKESLRQKNVRLKRKNEKIKKTTIKLMEQVRSLNSCAYRDSWNPQPHISVECTCVTGTKCARIQSTGWSERSRIHLASLEHAR